MRSQTMIKSLAVIRGTALNQDSRTDAMPMPNRTAQARLAREVCHIAGIEPHTVAYVESDVICELSATQLD